MGSDESARRLALGGDALPTPEAEVPLSDAQRRDLDETRRLLYALCFVEPGSVVPHELGGTLVNALAHHADLGFSAAAALRLVRSVVDAPDVDAANRARTDVSLVVDRITARLAGRRYSL